MALEIGATAPDFALKDEHGQLIGLSDLRDERNVVVVFFPFAFSRTCTDELCEIRDNIGMFESGDVQVLAVSCDPVHSLRAFSEQEMYAFPMLSDFWPHGATAQAYDVFNQTSGSAVRGSFLIDRQGIVRWSVVNGMGDARPLTAYREGLAALL